ncbi:hypothetical protein F5Y10DRAFT_259395 [Nemania abortiva]|nr:hypothetical protein F5Y10DRAFT_259395 [Nemania abortiva]
MRKSLKMMLAYRASLRPKAVALSSIRVSGIAFNAPSRQYSTRKHRMTRREKKAQAPLDAKDSASVMSGNTRELLYRCTDTLVAKLSSFIGKDRKQYLAKQRSLLRSLQTYKRISDDFHRRTISQLWKFTRGVMQVRIWLLDYLVMQDMAIILARISKLKRKEPYTKELRSQLCHVMAKIKGFSSPKCLEEMAEQRVHLFAIENVLQREEKLYARMQIKKELGEAQEKKERKEEEEQDDKLLFLRPMLTFPSSTLRAVETNLLIAEVLSSQLIVRKSLLLGLEVERDILARLVKLGYRPQFPRLTVEELDVD